MNTKIFELIQEQNGFRGLVWTEEDKKEFAELLIRECASIDFYNLAGFGLYHHDRVHQVIKEHFGVKE